jgi:uroporphyrin-III C-methyltransferase/precorrin-2 dehydrogenase/sirohydrochlorin ferrochelatase
MHHLPLFASLHDKHCLVVGGGVVAMRRVKLLLSSHASVTVRAPEICKDIEALAAEGRVVVERAVFGDMSVDRFWLVIAATSDETVNRAVAAAAASAMRFCNVVDDESLCSFIMPAIIDREPVTIAISTAGHSPVLARWIKGLIEAVVPARIGMLAKMLRAERAAVAKAIPATEPRRKFWEFFVTSDAASAVLSGRATSLDAVFDDALRQWADRDERGEAYLVGAGPGATDLITLRGRQLLARADVVMYDRLVNPEILEFARRDAEFIPVGKAAGKLSVTQEQINTKLVELVAAGKHVCRLKGGDPMIFGRAAEELAALAAAELPFQIVPGISAIGGCAAYAGIPLTWRGIAQTVLITTGHTESGAEVDWSTIGGEQTIALYMAATRHGEAARNLLERGLAGDLPVAIVENGTLPSQRVTRTTLGALAKGASTLELQSPALLLIGIVADISHAFAWFTGTPADNAAAVPESGAARVS